MSLVELGRIVFRVCHEGRGSNTRLHSHGLGERRRLLIRWLQGALRLQRSVGVSFLHLLLWRQIGGRFGLGWGDSRSFLDRRISHGGRRLDSTLFGSSCSATKLVILILLGLSL